MGTVEANLLILATAGGVLVAALWYADRLRYAFLLVICDTTVCVQRGKVTAAFQEEVRRVCGEHGVVRGWIGGVRQGGRIWLVFARSLPPGCRQQLRNVWGLAGWGAERPPGLYKNR
jgi:hypothetical protein